MAKQNYIVQISREHIKVAQAHSAGAGFRAAEFAAEDVQENDALSAQALASCLKRWRSRSGRVTLSISRNAATVRNLHLPSEDEREIAQMVDLNIVRMVPYKKEDVVSGHRIIGKDEVGFTRVLVVIVRADILRRQVAMVEKAGLLVERLTLSSYGLWNAYRSQPASEALMLVLDIDAGFTDCVIMQKDNLLFSRSINVGARNLISDPGSATLKFISEVKQSLVMFHNEEMNQKISGIVLCGAKAAGLLEQKLKDEFDVPVTVEASAKGVGSDVSVSSMAVLGGEGAAEAVLLLPEIQIRKTLRKDTADLVFFSGLFCYLLVLVGGFYWSQVYIRESHLKTVQFKTALLERELSEVVDKAGKTDFVKKNLNARQTPGVIVSEVQSIIPDTVAITAVSLDEKGKVFLRGQADGLATAFQFIDSLGGIKRFRDVQTRSTRKKKVRDRDLTEFEVSFTVE